MSQSGKVSAIAGTRDTATIGRGFNTGTYFPGDIAEILVYSRALSSTERSSVDRYLNGRYFPGGSTTPTPTSPVPTATPTSTVPTPTPTSAPPSPTATAPPPPANPGPGRLRYGVFDDGNLYSGAKMSAVLDSLSASGMNSLMLTNASAAAGDGLL